MKKTMVHFMFILFPLLLNGQNDAITDTSQQQDTMHILVKPMVTDVLSTHHIKINNAKYGSVILINVDHLSQWIEEDLNGNDSIVLFINGVEMKDLLVNSVNLSEQLLTFNLDRKSVALEKLKMNFSDIYHKLPVSLSVGKINGKPIDSLIKSNNFSLGFVGNGFILMSITGVFIFVLCFYKLIRKSNMLRGGSDGTPYSLSQAQLAFWSLIISISYIYIYATTQNIPEFPVKVLWLLGISITTTGGAKIIDNNKKPENYKYLKSKGFWVDIFSDNYGINIHRFQMIIWTLIMGVIFVITVIKEQKMIEFHDQLLMLMGISSGAYLGLKIPENEKPSLRTITVKENKPTEKVIKK